MARSSGAVASTPATSEEVQELRDAVLAMDALSQEGLSSISAIARLALKSLESPDAYCTSEDLAGALRAIWHMADDAKNNINCEADNVDCAYVSKAMLRRLNAFRIHQEKGNPNDQR